MKRVGAWSRRAGFTLIEALLATALMAIIMGALAQVTSQWLRNWNRGFARIQSEDLLAAGLDRLVADVASAEIIAGSASDMPMFDGAESAVMFVRTAVGPNTFTGLEAVRIEEASDNRGPALVRNTAPFTPAIRDLKEVEFANPVVLIRAPYRISFSYAGPDRVWRDTWRGAAQLPRAIRVSVRDSASSRTLAVSTSALIRAELPARCAAAKAGDACVQTQPASNSRAGRTTSFGAGAAQIGQP
ncbi:MAG TPA: prepilin-type N-terminal cleavage/methylation domain-containing protein [Xanthobacteraceae bacterium]|jgi:general secretion pathway protein J|nr:prepilin-type N-terminal cleavage/methylation domain-containing protein [Xanthobacteraceae bacterium]